jgi:hypothetical protein
MNQTDPFRNLNFEFRRSRPTPRLLTLGAAFIIFSLLWLIVPSGILYWLLLPVILGLTWAASYGWRPAVVTLVDFLNSLLQR